MSAIRALVLSEPSTTIAPSSRPSRLEPQSPMKTDAGWKLWTRKPHAAPAVIAARIPASSLPRSKAMIAKASAEIAPTPGGEPVDPVGEVDDVHHADEPDQREHVAGVAELDAADERAA